MNEHNEHIDDSFLNKDGLNKTPFSTPDGYFEGLEERLNLLKESSDDLGLPKNTPFSVPEGYFKQLNADQFKTDKSSGTNWYFTMSVAAIFLVCLAIFGTFDPQETESPHQTASYDGFDEPQSEWDLDESNLLAYIEDNYVNELQDEELSALLEGTDVLQDMEEEQTSEVVVTVEEAANNDDIITNIDEEDIESYLEEEYSVDELIDEL